MMMNWINFRRSDDPEVLVFCCIVVLLLVAVLFGGGCKILDVIDPPDGVSTSTTTSTSTTAADTTTPVTTSTSTTAAGGDHAGQRYRQITTNWKLDPSKAVQDIVLRRAYVVGNSLRLEYTCPNYRAWQPVTLRNKDGSTWLSYAGIQGWFREGLGFAGGWWDHLITSARGCITVRDFGNLRGIYWSEHPGSVPDYVTIMSSDGRHVSNRCEVEK